MRQPRTHLAGHGVGSVVLRPEGRQLPPARLAPAAERHGVLLVVRAERRQCCHRHGAGTLPLRPQVAAGGPLPRQRTVARQGHQLHRAGRRRRPLVFHVDGHLATQPPGEPLHRPRERQRPKQPRVPLWGGPAHAGRPHLLRHQRWSDHVHARHHQADAAASRRPAAHGFHRGRCVGEHAYRAQRCARHEGGGATEQQVPAVVSRQHIHTGVLAAELRQPHERCLRISHQQRTVAAHQLRHEHHHAEPAATRHLQHRGASIGRRRLLAHEEH